MTVKMRKMEQYVLYVPHRLMYFKMAHEYAASTPVHTSANVKFEANRNTWNCWWWSIFMKKDKFVKGNTDFNNEQLQMLHTGALRELQ